MKRVQTFPALAVALMLIVGTAPVAQARPPSPQQPDATHEVPGTIPTGPDFTSSAARDIGPGNPTEGDHPTLTVRRPNAITLEYFTAEASGTTVTLTWETGTEIDNAGFNLYRATAPDGPWTQINDVLIAAQGDPVSGATYTFLDEGLSPGIYFYMLESVNTSGYKDQYGPTGVRVGHAVYLPLIVAH